MKDVLKFFEEGEYRIQLKPTTLTNGEDMADEIAVRLITPDSSTYDRVVPDLSKDLADRCRTFYDKTLGQVFGVNTHKPTLFCSFYPYKKTYSAMIPKNNTLKEHNITDKSLRDAMEKIFTQMVVSKLAAEDAPLEQENPTADWPLQISADLRFYRYRTAAGQNYQFNVSEVIDSGSLVVLDLSYFIEHLKNIIRVPTSGDMIAIHTSRKVVTMGENDTALIYSDHLLRIIDRFFESFDRLVNSKEEKEDMKVERIKPADSIGDHPLDATFCIGTRSFGIGNCIFLPYPTRKLPKPLLRQIQRLRHMFGIYHRLYFNPKKKACWKFSNGFIEYQSLADFDDSLLESIQFLGEMLESEVEQGHVEAEARTHIFILTITSEALTITKFDSSECVYPFSHNLEIKELLEQLKLIPEAGESRICFLNSIAGHVFFHKTEENEITGSAPLGADVYTSLWNSLVRGSIFKGIKERKKLDLVKMKNDFHCFMLIDFSDTPGVIFDNRNRENCTAAKEDLPIHLQDGIDHIKEEILLPILSYEELKETAVMFHFRGDWIHMYLVDGDLKNYRHFQLGKPQFCMIQNFYRFLVDYRLPAFNRVKVQVYRNKIESVETNQIRIFNRSLVGNEKLDSLAREIEEKMLELGLIPIDCNFFFFTPNGDCGYNCFKQTKNKTFTTAETYEISTDSLTVKQEIQTRFGEFMKELQKIPQEEA